MSVRLPGGRTAIPLTKMLLRAKIQTRHSAIQSGGPAGVNRSILSSGRLSECKLSADSELKSRQIWCSADNVRAWQDWMLSKVAPKGKTTCKTPLDENIALGIKQNVIGTPGVFFADGTRLSGAADAAALEQKLADIAKK